MDKIFLSFKSKEQDIKYYTEWTKDSLNRLTYVLFFLISLNILLVMDESRKPGNMLENIKITTGGMFIVIHGITWLLLKFIRRYSKHFSKEKKYIAKRIPCYLFMIETPYVNSLLLSFLTISFEDATAILYVSVIIYFISSSILGIWWISLLIQIPAIVVYYMTLLQIKKDDTPEMNKQIDTVITGAVFAFAVAVASSYISEKQLKFNFQLKEELHVEKERIRDLFEMLPITIIKINRQTKETQLNQKAKDMLQYFNCSFEEFSRKTLLNNQQGSLWQEIVYEMNSLEKKNYRAEKNKNRDFVRIADYTFTYMRADKSKTIDYEIQFSQKPSMPDEVLIIPQKKNKQRKLKEEQLANIYKNNLIKGLSHDLKTPLNGVITLLNGFPREEKLKNNFQLIYMSAQFLHFKLKDMLDYSQIETGLFVLKQEPICLYNLFGSVLNLCQPQAELEEVFLSQVIDRGIPSSIIGDKDRIEQIIVHLLQNAIKYTPKRGIIILLAELVEGGLKLGVKDTGIGITKAKQKSIFSPFYQGPKKEFIDNRGIEEEVKENFSKKPKNFIGTKRNEVNIIQNNTFQGLGLQITKKLVKSLNSKLRIKSQKYQGSEFSFVLENYCHKEGNLSALHSKNERRLSFKEIYPSPRNIEEIKEESKILRSESCEELLTSHMYDFFEELDECNKEEIFIFKKLDAYKLPKCMPKQLVNIKSKTRTPGNEYRALVVDDNGVNRMAISGLLRRQGISVTQNMDGLEAVEEMKKKITRYKIQRDKTLLFNYIFMDLNMPNMDGIEATLLINNMLDEENIQIPIFALTAYDTDQLRKHCLSHGFAQFLVKPIKQDDLLNVLKKYQDFI